jgi:putative spermidine/putrescine transport system substrate-binding protein
MTVGFWEDAIVTDLKNKGQSRRLFLRSSGAFAAASMAVPGIGSPWVSRPAHAQDHEGQVVFAYLGGSTQTLFQKLIIPKFTEKTGVAVQYVPGTPADNVAKLRAQHGSSGIDVLQLAGFATYEAIDTNLVQPIDLSLVPNAANIDPSIPREPKILPLSVESNVLIYNKTVFDSHGWQAPTSWLDLWDPRLAGHTGMYAMNSTGGVAMLLQIAKDLTGDYNNLDPSFAKFKDLRKTGYDFFTSAGAWETAMQQGDLWLAVNSTARGMQLTQAGWPIGVVLPKNGVPSFQINVGIAADCPHPKAAHLWINYLLDKEVQQIAVENIGYAPSVAGAVIPQDVARFFAVPGQAWFPDWRKVNGEYKAIVDRWQREVER